MIPKDYMLVSESGIESPGDIKRLQAAGAQGFLIGELLLKRSDVEQAVKVLFAGWARRLPGMSEPTHFDGQGRAHMVDVSAKSETERVAVAQGQVVVTPSHSRPHSPGRRGRGDVLSVARLAGIMGRSAPRISLCVPRPRQVARTVTALVGFGNFPNSTCTGSVKATGWHNGIKSGVRFAPMSGQTGDREHIALFHAAPANAVESGWGITTGLERQRPVPFPIWRTHPPCAPALDRRNGSVRSCPGNRHARPGKQDLDRLFDIAALEQRFAHQNPLGAGCLKTFDIAGAFDAAFRH